MEKCSFEIEAFFELSSKKQVYVLARILDKDFNFKLTDDSRLGNVPIEKWFDIPRAQDANGNVRIDLFAFLLKNVDDKELLKIGDVTELIP
jgi:hypothetical protein